MGKGTVLLTFDEHKIGNIIKENRKNLPYQWEIPVDAKIIAETFKMPAKGGCWGIIFEHKDFLPGREQIQYHGDGEDLK